MKNNPIFLSPAFERILEQVKNIAGKPTTTLITGETGTGKEVVAKLIHINSRRKDQAFIPVNCTAIPEHLFESEMFGIERGVATGVEKRIGYFERAHRGTLFLDEIGDMPLVQQAKILRVIESRTITRVGGSSSIPVDFLLVSATNKDLRAAVEYNSFREDLFYRLNIINIAIPPIRMRRDDIGLMADFFLKNACEKMGRRAAMVIDKSAMERLVEYDWPGNCRELNNEMERLVVLTKDDRVMVEDLSPHIAFGDCSPAEDGEKSRQNNRTSVQNLPLNLSQAERILVLKSLSMSGQNKTEAARLLGISREGLRKKMIRMQLS